MSERQSPDLADIGKVLVVIPTYNESENIQWIIDRTRAAVPSAHILVADDNSPDGTGDIADAIAERDGNVAVLHRKGKEGLGAAYVAGFRWGLERGYDVLVEMDADGSHQPEQLPLLLAALRDADLAIGSRWVRGGTVVNWPLRRNLLSRCANLYAGTALRVKVKDITAGFRAFRRRTLEGIDLGGVTSQGYCFQIDLTRRAAARGFRIVEVPIEFVERERGHSKMSGAIIREAMSKVTAWGIARWLGRSR
ncbi:MAG TPA: polyprenol monophosphomannose synthase [Pilimelia sp.]|nr:polyprenol monophosphomannose synthase [Pilimelia sp.]